MRARRWKIGADEVSVRISIFVSISLSSSRLYESKHRDKRQRTHIHNTLTLLALSYVDAAYTMTLAAVSFSNEHFAPYQRN